MNTLSRVVFLLLSITTCAPSTAEAQISSWADRVRVSGSADVGFFGGGRDSVEPDDGFALWDARLFVDADLAEDVPLAGRTAIRNIGFTFEWNIVRNGSTPNNVGLAYVDLEGLANSPWLNLRVGRFQIPFGEAYGLYSKGYAKRFFVQQPIGGPWWWDEGIMLHGSRVDGRFGYVASVTNGDSRFNNAGGETQATLKLWTQPLPELYLSASGLWSAELGQVDGALWLGEAWARPFGSGGPPIPNLVDGRTVPDDPDGLGQLWAVGLDAILTPIDGVRLWLSGGRYEIDSKGLALYDRTLWYWLGEIVLDGRVVSAELHPLFVGLRVDGIGTWDEDRGYLLDVRHTSDYGYNMEKLIAYTAVVGWHLGEYVTARAEYSRRDVDLVRGASSAVPGRLGDHDLYVVEIGLHF